MLVTAACGGAAEATNGRSAAEDDATSMARDRPFLPRLSGMVRYAACSPVRSVCRRPEDLHAPGAPVAPPSVIRATSGAAARLRASADAEALHTLALIDLVWGRAGNSLDRSIESLERASHLANARVGVFADLAAAYLIRADRDSSLFDVLRALDAAREGAEFDSNDVRLRFNEALARQRLGLALSARTAWRQASGHVGTDPWAAEAARRADAIDTITVQRIPRLYAMDTLLGVWGQSLMRGDAAAARAALDAARAIGISTASRDSTTIALVTAIDSARSERRRALAVVHAAYAAGRQSFEQSEYDDALASFDRALAGLATKSILRTAAALYRASTLVYLGRVMEGQQGIRRGIAAIDTSVTPALAGHARGMLATTLLRSGDYEEALKTYSSAAQLFAAANEMQHAGAMWLFAAQAANRLGDAAQTQRFTLACLDALGGSATPWKHSALLFLSRLAAGAGLTSAAAAISDEDVEAARRIHPNIFLVEGELARSRLRALRNDSAGATADINAARTIVEALDTGATRRWFEADLFDAEATAAARFGGRQTPDELTHVVDFFAQTKNSLRLVPALAARAEAWLGRADTNRALTDLDRAVATLKSQRRFIKSESNRAAFLETVRRVFDRAAQIRVAQRDDATALEYVEQSRAVGGPPIDAAASIRRAMNDSLITVDYAVLGDSVVAWVLGRKAIHAVRLPVASISVRKQADELRIAMETSGIGDVDHLLSVLFDELIRPIESRLPPDARSVAIVADGEIAAIPFAALRDGRSGRFLLERWAALRSIPALVGPSASRIDPAAAKVAVVADPDADLMATRGLRPLAHAREEGLAIAATYPHAKVIDGPRATPRALREALLHADIVHFAGHAVVASDDPRRSSLLLSGGELSSDELEHLDLRGVRLVVLAACETSPSRAGRTGALGGLSQSMLRAGARGVVGSLWRVDDEATRDLMVHFHQAFRARGNAAEALRDAQLALLASSNAHSRSPAAWAAFVYVGR
jgi:CHAT domain-containing protein/tetratricopeptide (TPR) repeat protein